MPAFGEGERLAVTGSTHDPYGFRKTDDPEVHARLVARINEKVLSHRREIIETESYFMEDAETAVIAYGFTARTSLYVVKRLRKEGVKVGFLRLKTIWPFPDEAVMEAAKGLKAIVVPEMNRGQVAGEVQKHCRCDVIPLGQTNGEVIPPETILDRLRRMRG
jgi:2-oxoglutarate ferredoxin oxidoreductase subunit alpha